jgi:tetratricopeptide (TPR) repeat protein
MVALVHYSRGYTLLLLKRYAEALAALDEADRIAVRMPDGDSLRHRIAGHRAWIEVEQGQVGPARQSSRVLAWQRAHDLVAASVTLTRLAKLELRDRHPWQALPHAEEALRIAEQGHFRDERRESLEVLVRSMRPWAIRRVSSVTHGLLGESARQGGQAAALVSLARLQARAQQSLTAPAQQSRRTCPCENLRNAAVAALVGLLAVGGAALWWMSTRQRRAGVPAGSTPDRAGQPREADRLIASCLRCLRAAGRAAPC